MKLSELIVNYRTRMSISQREFSRKCGLSNTYISFLEKENNPKTGKPLIPTLEQYKKIADGMDISVHRLFELLDTDAPVDLRVAVHEFGPDLQETIRTPEARILARGIDKLPQAQREQALAVVRAMFEKYADYFEKEQNDDT